MHSPFTEFVDESADADLIEQAKHGSREALEKLVLRHQAWIYNIAVRMVFNSQDAEEVTQEVLIKAITRLSTFQGESQFRTWLYRIAANHVLNRKRRGGETVVQSFSSYSEAINTHSPGYSSHSASKAGLDAVTGVLAKELAPRGLRVNSVNPNATLSAGTKGAGLYGTGSDIEKHFVAMTPLGRMGTPEDSAKVVAFPASADSGWLTGEVILASGGLR
jgi:RNA polymerase sigma factor (sigma-70 family)